jgi:hypothetical protein
MADLACFYSLAFKSLKDTPRSLAGLAVTALRINMRVVKTRL